MFDSDDDDISLLTAVDQLRGALPPELPPSELISASTGSMSRSSAVAALQRLSATLAARRQAVRLHQVQIEVVFRQISHALAVIYSWGASGTSEAALEHALGVLRGLFSTAVLGESCTGEIISATPMHSTCGHLVSTLLGLAGASMHLSSTHRASCVRTIRTLFQLQGMDIDMIAFFLPGVATRLASLASCDEKASTFLLVEVVSAMRAILLACLSDDANAAAVAHSPCASLWARELQKHAAAGMDSGGIACHDKQAVKHCADPDASNAHRVVRSHRWLQDTARRLGPLLARICAAAASGNWRARLQLVITVREVVKQCAYSLEPAVPRLLDFVYASTRDPCIVKDRSHLAGRRSRSIKVCVSFVRPCRRYSRVAQAALSTLDTIGRKLHASATLSALARDGFEAQLRSLTSVVRGVDERSKARAFAIISAQLDLFYASGELRRVLSATLGTLSTVLLGALAMATPEGYTIEMRQGFAARLARQRLERPPATARLLCEAVQAHSGVTAAAKFISHAQYTPKPFLHLRDKRTVDAVAELCGTQHSLSP